MTSASKPVSKFAVSREDLRGVSLYRVAIVGAASLKGKEIAEILRNGIFRRLTSACSMMTSRWGGWKRLATR